MGSEVNKETNPSIDVSIFGFVSLFIRLACLLRARARLMNKETNPKIYIDRQVWEMIVGINRSKEQQRLSSK